MKGNQNNPVGSIWNKWDLHIHSPATKKANNYIQDGKTWEKFYENLETSDVMAFGITDYFSVDTYFKVRDEFYKKYPDSNKVLFPNIELNLDRSSNGKNDGYNVHLILDNNLPDEKINKLLSNIILDIKDDSGGTISAADINTSNFVNYESAYTTKEKLQDAVKKVFGDKKDYLIATVLHGYRGMQPEPKDGVKPAIAKNTDDELTDIFFGCDQKDYDFGLNKNNTRRKCKPKPVVTGSDSHSFKHIVERLGKKFLNNPDETELDKQRWTLPTWIKADLTFEGLKQITYEPEDRVELCEETEVDLRVKNNPRKYIKTLSLKHSQNYHDTNGKWFDNENIPLGKELVAIIGNKGSGKSAITDVIGLLGNSYNQFYYSQGKTEELFSFLNKDKFLKLKLASNFSAELQWYSGNPETKIIDENTDINAPESVEYLPQKYLEKICSNINETEFRSKLNQVIFAYVDGSAKYENSNLEDLIKYLSRQANADIEILKIELHKENENVIELEKKMTSNYKKSIDEKLKQKNEELGAHKKLKPKILVKPVDTNSSIKKQSEKITEFETKIDPLRQSITKLSEKQNQLSKTIEDATQLKIEIDRQINQINIIQARYKNVLDLAGLSLNQVVEIKPKFKKLNSFLETKNEEFKKISNLLLSNENISALDLPEAERLELKVKSIKCQLNQLLESKRKFIEGLDKATQEYQKYVSEKEKWKLNLTNIEGDKNDPAIDTVNWYLAELNRIINVYPTELVKKRTVRKIVSEKIYEKKIEVIKFYNSVKKSIDAEILKFKGDLNDYDISIDVSVRIQSSFCEEFFRYINQGVKGSFYGSEDGKSVIRSLIDNVGDWREKKVVFDFLDLIIEYLDKDSRVEIAKTDTKRDVFNQLKATIDPVSFYDYLFGMEYLHTKYDLKVDNKDLIELSPGERGGLLLIFYLMLDKREIPLVIDQPEDNLDNKSVYQILVKFLKRAKKRRQIIMVTHNPNLAVVADAEQIIHVMINKKDGNDFSFNSGSIENPLINRLVVDILEGTMPAFDNRKLKYRKQLGSKV